MNIRFLETFIWVARMKSFTLAAERLHATQAAVSQRIVSLEETLGVRLFARDGRDVRLTRQGHRLLVQAEAIVRLYDGMRELNNATEGKREIFIGFAEAAALTFVPMVCHTIIENMESVTINGQVGLSPTLDQMLRSGLLDYSISHVQATDEDTISIPLCDFGLRWAASPNLSVPRGMLTFRQLAEMPIVYPQHSLLHQIVNDKLGRCASKAARLQLSGSIPTMVQLALDASGVCLVAPAVVQRELSEGSLRLLEVEGTLPYIRFYLSHAAGAARSLSRLVARSCLEAIALFSRGVEFDFIRCLASPDDVVQ